MTKWEIYTKHVYCIPKRSMMVVLRKSIWQLLELPAGPRNKWLIDKQNNPGMGRQRTICSKANERSMSLPGKLLTVLVANDNICAFKKKIRILENLY